MLIEALSTALKAPKALVMLRASSSIGLPRRCRLARRAPRRSEHREDAAREEARNHDDDGAVDDEGKPGALAAEQTVGDFLQRNQDHGTDQRSEQQTATAEGRHNQHLYRDQNAKTRFRVD